MVVGESEATEKGAWGPPEFETLLRGQSIETRVMF